MDAASEIERQLGFTLPKVYRAFADRGYLTYPGSSYLWVHEAEWFPLARMPDQRGIAGMHVMKPGFVAFAHSGGGDLWCWQTLQAGNSGEYPIAFCPRDSFWGWWHAPSFIGWLYRTALESVAPFGDDEAEAREHLRRWAEIIREFGHPDWAADVEAIAMRPSEPLRIGSRKDKLLRVLLTQAEVTSRIQRAFGGGYIDADFAYDVNGEPGKG
jgi:hypothetical protein